MDYTAFIEIRACCAAAATHFALGSVVAFSAILIPQLESPDSEIKVTKDDISWIASVVALVMPISALITGYLVDKIGRLNTIRLATIPFVIGWICIAMAQNLTWVLVGRIFTGFSTALGSNPAVVYITEVARPGYRGALTCMAPSLVSLGMVVIYAAGAYLHWRNIAWMSISFCVTPILFMNFWSPESPIWLISKGRTQDTLKSLTYLLKKEKKVGSAQQRLSELLQEHNKCKGRGDEKGTAVGNLLRNLSTPISFKPLILLTVIFIFQQFSGIYITIFYTVTFFKSMGANVDPYLSTVGVGLVRLVMGLITSILLKNFGRRPLFMLSAMGMAIFIFLSGYFTKQIAEGNMEANLIPVVFILLYMSIGVIGFMTIPWTMTAEVFATEIRGMAQGLVVGISSLVMFAALKIYPFLDDYLGGAYGTQWLFAVVSLIAVLFIFIFFCKILS